MTKYTIPAGISELREACAEKFHLDGIVSSPAQVVVTPGGKFACAVKKLLVDYQNHPQMYTKLLRSESHSHDIEYNAFPTIWDLYFDPMPLTVNCRVSEGIQYVYTTGDIPSSPWTWAECECISLANEYLTVIKPGWAYVADQMAEAVKSWKDCH